MKMPFITPKALALWKTIKPWITMVVVLLILRYTGALSGISYLTGRVLIGSGAMNASTAEPAVAKSFNYNFKIRDLNGAVIDFKQFKGKTIFLNVWATWCGPCRIEMPSIQKLYDTVDNENIVFVMLSIDQRDQFERVVSFVKKEAYSFPVYVPKGYLPEQLQVKTIPTTFIVSPDGKIVAKEVGVANYNTEEFRNFLNGLASKSNTKVSID